MGSIVHGGCAVVHTTDDRAARLALEMHNFGKPQFLHRTEPLKIQRIEIPGPWKDADAGFYGEVKTNPPSAELIRPFFYHNGAGVRLAGTSSALRFLLQVDRKYYYTTCENNGNVPYPDIIVLTVVGRKIQFQIVPTSGLDQKWLIAGLLQTLGVSPSPDGTIEVSLAGQKVGKLAESTGGTLRLIGIDGTILAPIAPAH